MNDVLTMAADEMETRKEEKLEMDKPNERKKSSTLRCKMLSGRITISNMANPYL